MKGVLLKMRGSLIVKNNIYYAKWRDNNQQQHMKTLKVPATRGNKRKAEQALNELLKQLEENQDKFNKIKFVEYIESWLKQVKISVDIVTYSGYEQYAEKHIIPYFKNKDIFLQDVKITDIEGYYNYKSVGGRLDGKPGGLSLRTIKLHSVVLNLVFKNAIYERLIDENPCTHAKFPIQKSCLKTEPTFYTVQQCNELLAAIKNTPLYNMVYITFLYGLRRSELMGLKWSAIDFENNTLTIQHTVVLHNEVVYKNKTKNATSKRKYPLLPEIRMLLENMLEEQKTNQNLIGKSYIYNDYVFVKIDGTPYYPSYPTHELKKVIKKNNLPYIRWHDLRHSCASMLIEKKWHMKDISEWLGHSDIGTTMNIYGHISMEHKKELGNSLKGIFDN